MVSCFRQIRKRVCSVLALGCLVGSAALAQSVETSHRPGIDFSKYHTYKWVENKNQYADPTVDTKIKQSFDTQLAAKGLRKTDGAADLSVDYQSAVSRKTKSIVYEDWTQTGPDQRIPQRKQITIDVGTLRLDMNDSASNQLVWTGSAKKVFAPKSSIQDRENLVDNATKTLLADFPPK